MNMMKYQMVVDAGLARDKVNNGVLAVLSEIEKD